MNKFYIALWVLLVLGFKFANSWKYPTRRRMETPGLMFEDAYHIEDKLAYAICDGNHRKVNCTVYREKFPYQDPPYSCNIKVKPEKKGGHIANPNPLYVIPFGKDKSIVVWSESTRPWCLKLMTIKMNSCNSSEAIICQHTKAFQHLQNAATIVPYNDYYDVIFKNRTMCNDFMCRMTIDADSNIINGPHASVLQSNNSLVLKNPFSPSSDDSVDKGFISVVQSKEGNDTVYNYTLIHKDGSETSLAKIKENPSKPMSVSTSSGLIGICYGTNNTIFNCTQYYVNGTMKHNLTFTANEPWKYIADMYNLPNGGLLILAYNKKILHNYFRYTLVKVNSDGPRYKTLEIPTKRHYFGSPLSHPQVFLNKKAEYCVSSIVYDHNDLDLYADCLTDSDFINFDLAIPKEETLLRKTVLISKPGPQLLFNSVYHIEDKLAYALCNKSETEKNCTVIREKFPFQDPPYSCNITLRPEKEMGKLGLIDPFDVIPFGEDNVIISWSERDRPLCLKLTTVKMSSCNISEAIVCQDTEVYPYPKEFVYWVEYYDVFPAVIVGHDNYYDVIFENRTSCQNSMCKMTFDADSKLINGPVSSVHQIERKTKKKRFSPMSTDTWGKGLFYVGQSEVGKNTIYNFTVVHADGSEMSIDKVKDNRQPVHTSTTNGIVGVCYNVTNTFYNCTQYFGNGTVKHNLTFTAGEQWSEIVDMYNLPDGGFLILANVINEYYNYFIYDIMKVNFDGQTYKTIEIKHQAMHYRLRRWDAQVFLYERKNYCISIVVYNLDDGPTNSYMDLYADCFTDSDLLSEPIYSNRECCE